jgi:hypothetical protein
MLRKCPCCKDRIWMGIKARFCPHCGNQLDQKFRIKVRCQQVTAWKIILGIAIVTVMVNIKLLFTNSNLVSNLVMRVLGVMILLALPCIDIVRNQKEAERLNAECDAACKLISLVTHTSLLRYATDHETNQVRDHTLHCSFCKEIFDADFALYRGAFEEYRDGRPVA